MRKRTFSIAILLLATPFLACGSGNDSGSDNAGAGTTSTAGTNSGAGTTSSAGTSSSAGKGGAPATGGMTGEAGGPGQGQGGSEAGGSPGSGGAPGAEPTAEEVAGWIEDYQAAHPGNGGMDWDINSLTPEQIAADPLAQQLLGLCGEDERPIIPLLAWEYGGADHQWINPEAAPLVICVYIPVNPSTEHWAYDDVEDHVTADVYVRFPEQNPCKDELGADQVMLCLGDETNIEIIVDTASLNDGMDVGYDLSEATTDLYLIEPDDTKVHLYTGL